MPDNKDYRAAQSAHAQKLRAERTVMDMTGASRSQIRAALSNFAQRQLSARLFVPQEPAPKPEPLPVLAAPEQKFEPRPFLLGQDLGSRVSTALPPVDLLSQGDPTASDLVYVMRSKKFGSVDVDDDTAPLGLDVANPDTYESWNPPYKTKVNIVTTTVGASPNNIEATAHGIPTGGTWTVVISGSDTTPSTDGRWQATRVDANNFTIPTGFAVTSAGTGAGTVALVYNAVEYTDGPREELNTTQGLTTFNDTGAVAYGFYNEIYDRFTRKITWYLGGHFKIHEEINAQRLSNFSFAT